MITAAIILAALFGPLLIVGTMSLAGRAHGAAYFDSVTQTYTGWPSWARTAATVLFALTFGAASYIETTYILPRFGVSIGIYWRAALAVAGGALSAYGLATGHGRFYAMGGANLNDPNPEWIEKYCVMWWYPGDIAKPFYSYVCMSVKGAMIGAAVFPFGLALVLLWPICYGLSFHYWTDSAPGERMSGACAGFVLLAVALISCLPSDLGLAVVSPLF